MLISILDGLMLGVGFSLGILVVVGVGCIIDDIRGKRKKGNESNSYRW